jgi:hypothetical protein
MITLVSGDQTLTLSLKEAENVLKIQAIMKATTWELPSQYQLKDGVIIRSDKSTSRSKTKKD